MKWAGAVAVILAIGGFAPLGKAGDFCIQNDGNMGQDAPNTRAQALILGPGHYLDHCIGPGVGDPEDWFKIVLPSDHQGWLNMWSGLSQSAAQAWVTIEVEDDRTRNIRGFAWYQLALEPGSIVWLGFSLPMAQANYSIHFDQVQQPIWGIEIDLASSQPGIVHATIKVSNKGVGAGTADLLVQSWSGGGTHEDPSCLFPIEVEPGAEVVKLVHAAGAAGGIINVRLVGATQGFRGSETADAAHWEGPVAGFIPSGPVGDLIEQQAHQQAQPILSCEADDPVWSKA